MKHAPDLYYALCEAIVHPQPGQVTPEDGDRAALRLSSTFLREQLAALPAEFGVLVRLGLLAFRVAVRLRYQHGFCRLSLAKRQAIVTWWAFGPIGLTRTFFRPIRSTALLAYYERTSAAMTGAAKS